MKYLVTGATGALGGAIVRLLAGERKDFRVLVEDKKRFTRMMPGLETEVVVGNALHQGDLQRSLEGVDVVFHCVSFPLTSYEPTIEAASLLVEMAANRKIHIVYPGNTWVFGKPEKLPITPYTPFNPPTYVARIEAETDAILMSAWRDRGTAMTVVHLPDLYGPGVTNRLLRPLFEGALAGKRSTFPGPVDGPHQFIFVDDAARALLTVGGKERSFGQRYTVGGLPSVTVREFCRMIYQIAGTNGQVNGTSILLLRLAALLNAEAKAMAEIMHVFAWDVRMDNYKMQFEFGYSPQVNYTNGIWETVQWFRKEKK